MKKTLFIISLLAISMFAWGQTTASNIWLFSLSYDNDLPRIEQAIKITDNGEYSNQPHFLPDGQSLYFTQALRDGNNLQMDTFQYQIQQRQHTNLTNSKASEYSPTPLPEDAGFSMIKVDEQGKQWLWGHSENKNLSGKLLDAEPVGYHVWTSVDTVLAFILGEPHTLQSLTLSGHQQVLDEHIGASLWPIPGTNMFSYTKNPAPDSQPWTLMAYDKDAEQSTVLATMPGNNQYMAWTQSAEALVVHDSTIVSWSLAPTNGDGEERGKFNEQEFTEGDEAERWQPWLDIAKQCPKGASRLHLSKDNNYLAVVCNE